MELHHLRTFVIVADEGSVTKAAQRLFMTPPTISGHIRVLEEELNVVLFERTSRGMKLTEKGSLLREKAEKTLLAAQDFVNHATELQTDLIGEVRLGLNASPQYLRVFSMTQQLIDSCPGISIQLVNDSTGKIMEQLLSGTLDMGFIFGEAESPLLTTQLLSDVELFIAVPSTFVQSDSELTWNDLALLPWIYTDYYCPFQNSMEQIFADHGLEPKHKVLSNDEETRLNLVRSGVGASLLMKEMSLDAIRDGEVVAYPHTAVSLPLQLAYRADKANNPLLQPVVQTILDVWYANEESV